MIQFRRIKFLLPINEIYFYNDELDKLPKSCLPSLIIQSKNPINGRKNKISQTLLIDLKKNEDELFAEVKKGFRYDIKQSNNDDVLFDINVNPKSHDIDKFVKFYDASAARIKLRKSNKSKLTILSKNEALVLSEAKTKEGKPLVVHAFLHDTKRLRLLYSASIFREADKSQRALIGRTNKALHWAEIKFGRKTNFDYFDFGGVSLDGSTLSIDKFKSSFGGRLRIEYNVFSIGKVS